MSEEQNVQPGVPDAPEPVSEAAAAVKSAVAESLASPAPAQAADAASDDTAPAAEVATDAGAEGAEAPVAEAAAAETDAVPAADFYAADAAADSDAPEPPAFTGPASDTASEFAGTMAKPAAGIPMVAWIVIAVAALIVGLLIGVFALGGAGGSSELAGATTVSEAKLNTTIASITANGKKTDVSVREVIESTGSLETAKDAEGNYRVPSADIVLDYARNQVLLSEAQTRGVSLSDEELDEFAVKTIGTSDYATIAQSYSMSEDAVKSTLRTSAMLQKLRDEVVGADAAGATMPTEPPAPESSASAASASADESPDENAGENPDENAGDNPDENAGEGEEAANEEAADSSEENADATEEAVSEAAASQRSKVYADYIISLAGDEWDASKGTWVSADGPFASALASYDVTADGATYEAATTAYYIAYQQYTQAMSVPAEAWNDFTAELLAKATIVINTLIA